MLLKQKKTIEIIPTSPFHFDGTFFKPDHFTTDDHIWKHGIRWQTLNWQNEKLGLVFRNTGSITEPLVAVDIFSDKKLSPKFIESLKQELIYRFNLNLDLNTFYEKGSKSSALNMAINNLYGMRPGHPSSLYEYLIIAVLLQNASVRRSVSMFRSLLTRYGSELSFDGQKLLCLWQPGDLVDVKEDELRALKIGYRARSLLRIDEQFKNGFIDEENLRNKPLETQKAELLSLYGVGPATVWYLLFDIFHRWDVFDHISPWEQKLYSQMFFGRGLDDLATIPELLKYINQFGEYKHLAIHYLWEDLWWRRFNGENIPWLEKEIRA